MPTLSQDQVRKIIEGRPAGTSPEDAVNGLVQRGYQIDGLSAEVSQPIAPEGTQGLKGVATGFAKSLGNTVRNIAFGTQRLGQKYLGAITPGQTEEDIRQTTGIKFIDNAAPEGAAAKEILTPKGTAEKTGAFIEQAAEFLVPASKVAKLTEKAGKVAKIASNVATDVAVTAAQEGGFDKSGKTAAISAGLSSIPLVGNLVKSKLAPITETMARNLEQINLRLTPVQKTQLAKDQRDIVGWLAKKKVTGTPEQRYDKMLKLVDDYEDQVQMAIEKSGKKYTKQEIIDAVKGLPDELLQTVDSPQVYNQMQRDVESFVEFVNRQPGDFIDASRVNQFKRNYAREARNKAGDTVINDSRAAISDGLYGILQKDVDNLKNINTEYSRVLTAEKLLGKALGRNELGLIGKLIAAGGGATLGGAVGGPVGSVLGASAGPELAKILAGTATRSNAGSALVTLSNYLAKATPDNAGNFVIPRSVIQAMLSD